MGFKIGDKIRVIDDDLKGRIIRIHKNRITILNEFGFEETYNSDELIPDESLSINEVLWTEEETENKQKPKKSKHPVEVKVIDLHIGELLDFHKNLSNYEMLQIQLKKINDEIELARAEKRDKLIFIHGHGSGKLKKELIKLLKTYPKLEFYDASFRIYNGGALEVKFH